MAPADIVMSVKPSDPKYLRNLEYPLHLFEQFSQFKQILLQFEIVADKVLIFWQSAEDLEHTLEFMSSRSLGELPNYSPSEHLISWECRLIKSTNNETESLMEQVAKKMRVFVENVGKVLQDDGSIAIYLPEDFTFDKYLTKEDFSL